jgi:geranylgeranylglycerol-phosphate geranylgeranyltransferase
LYLLGTLPSWLTFLLLLPGGLGHALGFTSLDVAGFFLSPESILGHALRDPRSVLNIKMSLVYGTLLPLLLGTLLFRTKRGHFLALLRNSRLPQVVYHAGLVFLGILLAWVYAPPSPALSIFDALAALLLAFSAVLAWLSSVAVNDLYDVQIDRLTNPRRPLPTGAMPTADYLTYGALFFGGSLLLAGVVSFGALLALLAYQAIAFLYSAYPYRLKRFPIVATLLAALCGLLTISAGYLAASADLSLRSLPPRLFFFLGLTYTLLLPLKDLKDIAGDRRDGVYTLPVLLGEKKARLLLGGFAFLAFSVSPALLNLPKALFPAFLFGSAAFWLVQLSGQRERSFFCYHRLSGVMIALAFAYGICLTFLAFR